MHDLHPTKFSLHRLQILRLQQLFQWFHRDYERVGVKSNCQIELFSSEVSDFGSAIEKWGLKKGKLYKLCTNSFFIFVKFLVHLMIFQNEGHRRHCETLAKNLAKKKKNNLIQLALRPVFWPKIRFPVSNQSL